jgi:dUTP pyrophosphatase
MDEQLNFEFVNNIIEVEVMEDGILPSKAHQSDAGFDLYASEDVTLYRGQITKHPLNIKLKLPQGTYARIETKSGLGSKGMLVYAGIIDEEYRGIPHVVCTLLTPDPLTIKKGQKIAQLIMEPYSPKFSMQQVDSVSTETARSSGGFGSTGV